MPGVRRGQGFELDDLGPGINVVFGPNGSGKTTVARAMQKILWPASDPNSSPSLTATLALDESTWRTEVEGRIVRWLRDGVEVSPPDVGGEDARHRYRLALAELVAGTQDDALFADEIERAVVGGFDLEDVRRRGGFAGRPAGRGTGQKEVEDAHRALEGAIRNEAGLQQRSTLTLSELRHALVEARRAVSLEGACDKAIEQKNARALVERLERERDSLPLDRLEACHANDVETLDDLERRIEGHQVERRELTLARDESSEAIGEIDLGGEGIPSATMERLEELAAELETSEQELNRLRGEVPRLRAERDSCVARLEDELSPAQLAALDRRLGIPEAEELARSSHELAGERASIRASLARLSPLDSEADPNTLREGRQILAYWMAEPEVGAAEEMVKRHRVAVALLALLGAGLAVALSLLQHPLWSIASAPLALLAWLALRSGADRPGGPRARRAAFRDKYAKLELPQPESWTVECVTESLREIERRLDAARESDAQRRQHDALDRSERDLRERERDHAARRARLEARLGIALPGGQAWLPVLASNLLRWHSASDGLSATEARIDDTRRRLASLLEEAGRLARRFAQPDPETAAAVRRSITRLEEISRALHARAKAESTLAGRVEPALAETRRMRSEFFAQRGLEEGDRHGLQALLAVWKELRDLEGRIQMARGAARQAATGVAESEDLSESPLEELKLRRTEYAAKAARHDETLTEISKIEHEIEDARRGHEVTDARHRLERAKDALCRLRDDEGERAVGQALLEQVRTRARETSVPEVFDRARRILARITAGRFELLLPAADEGSFRAYDTSDGIEKALEDLSTGERVQLLLSVRLGFLEHQERDRLPLLLDETLGTSDDDRVREMLDALIEVARAGRQVFYFTAQHDEEPRARWPTTARIRATRAQASCRWKETRIRMQSEDILLVKPHAEDRWVVTAKYVFVNPDGRRG